MVVTRAWLFALVGCLLLGSMDMTMAEEAEPIILDDRPMNSVAATLDLKVKEGTLAASGQPGTATLATVLLGTPEVLRPEPTPETRLLLPPQDGSEWHFYYVTFPLTLNPPPQRTRYEKMSFMVTASPP